MKNPDFAKKKMEMERLAKAYIHRSDQQLFWNEVRDALIDMPPTICFSRKLGVGTLALAERIGDKIGYRVIDKEIVEYIAAEAELNVKSVKTYDESDPGLLQSFLGRLLGDRSFQLTHYAEYLFSTIYFLAASEPTIFVGRGAHLILPREKVFAVRCISSLPFRVTHVSQSRSITEAAAGRYIEKADQEQKAFYQNVYRKTDAHASEFDIVINFDHLQDETSISNMIITLFKNKFSMP